MGQLVFVLREVGHLKPQFKKSRQCRLCAQPRSLLLRRSNPGVEARSAMLGGNGCLALEAERDAALKLMVLTADA